MYVNGKAVKTKAVESAQPTRLVGTSDFEIRLLSCHYLGQQNMFVSLVMAPILSCVSHNKRLQKQNLSTRRLLRLYKSSFWHRDYQENWTHDLSLASWSEETELFPICMEIRLQARRRDFHSCIHRQLQGF